MGVYTCTKPATFAGVKYKPGDTVPAEAIPADRVGAVIRLGLIAEAQPGAAGMVGAVDQQPPASATFTVPIMMEDGATFDMEVTPEAVAQTVGVLQVPVEEAASRIAAMTDDATLHLIYACDSRKTIKKAAANRAAALAEEPGTGESGGPEEEPGTGEHQDGGKGAETPQEAPDGQDDREPTEGGNGQESGQQAQEGAE